MRAVLITIADAANANGEHAHPGIDAMVNGSSYSRASVFTALGKLADEGWIEVAEAGGGRGKATVYRVVMDRETVQPSDPSVSETVQKGSSPAHETVQSDPLNGLVVVPKTAPNITTNGLSNVNAPSFPQASFERWWSHYPRKVAKGAARSAYAKAARKADEPTLLQAVARYANDPNLPEAQYIPHPATWLNEERWLDGPMPRRGSGRESESHAALQRAIDRRGGGHGSDSSGAGLGMAQRALPHRVG